MSQIDEKETEKSYGGGSGTTHGYIVEARSTFHEPGLHHGMIVDSRWRRVNFAKHPLGVISQTFNVLADDLELLSHEAANALARWFLCPDSEHFLVGRAYSVETRLVRVQLKYEYSTKELGVGQPISAFQAERNEKFEERKASEVPHE